VHRAGTVFASFAIPAIAIARDPTIHALGEKMNSRHEQKPGEQLPTGQREPNSRPGIRAGVDAPTFINRLHEPHGLFGMDLREARWNGRVVQIESFDPVLRVDMAQTGDAGAAEIAASVVEDS